jgi:hypothetical protein
MDSEPSQCVRMITKKLRRPPLIFLATHSASTVMPTVVDSTSSSDPSVDASGSLAVVASLSSSSYSDSPTVVTFSRPLTMPSDYSTDAEIKDLKAAINQPIIYALGPANPGNSDPATDVEQHSLDSMGA